MPGKTLSIQRTMVPIEYDMLSHNEWRNYIHLELYKMIRPDVALIVEATRLTTKNRMVKKEQPKSPEPKFNGDKIVYGLLIVCAVVIAIISYLKNSN